MATSIRTSPLAQIRVLSLSSLFFGPGKGVRDLTAQVQVGDMEESVSLMTREVKRNLFGRNNRDSLFSTIGLARNIRTDENYGTQLVYGIGQPTRPMPVPNNYSVAMSIERIKLDARNLSHYVTDPSWFYSPIVHRLIGVNDWLLYTYIYARTQEEMDNGVFPDKIYAVMPTSNTESVTSSSPVISDSYNFIGYSVTFPELAESLVEALLEPPLAKVIPAEQA